MKQTWAIVLSIAVVFEITSGTLAISTPAAAQSRHAITPNRTATSHPAATGSTGAGNPYTMSFTAASQVMAKSANHQKSQTESSPRYAQGIQQKAISNPPSRSLQDRVAPNASQGSSEVNLTNLQDLMAQRQSAVQSSANSVSSDNNAMKQAAAKLNGADSGSSSGSLTPAKQKRPCAMCSTLHPR